MILSTPCTYDPYCKGTYCLQNALIRKDEKAARKFLEDHPITASPSFGKINNLSLAIRYLPNLNLLTAFLKLDPKAVHFIDVADRYPLLEAAERMDPEVLDLLFEHSADANFCDSSQKITALHHLAELTAKNRTPKVFEKIIRAAEILIDHGARVDLTDKHGRTPLTLYMTEQAWSRNPNLHPDFISTLIAEGATPTDARPIEGASDQSIQKIQQAIQNGRAQYRDRVIACKMALEPVLPNPFHSAIISFLYCTPLEPLYTETPRN